MVGAGLAGRVLTLATLPLYTRALTPEEFGVVAFGTAITMAVAVFASLSLPSAAARFAVEARTGEERRELLGTTLRGVTIVGGVVALVLFILGPRMMPSRLLEPAGDAQLIVALLALVLLLRAVAANLSAYGLAVGRHRGVGVCELAEQVVRHGLLVTLALGGWLTPASYFVGAVIGVAVMVALLAAVNGHDLSFRWNAKIARRAVAFSLPLVLHSAAYNGIHYLDRMVLGTLVPAADLGRYHLNYSLVFAPFAVVMLLVRAWTPWANLGFAEDDAGIYEAMSALVVAGGIVVAISVVVGMELVFPYLFTPEYAVSPRVTGILVASELCYLSYTASVTPMTFFERHRWLPLITVAGLLTNGAALLVLVPHLNIEGAALATLAAFAVMGVGTSIAAQSSTGLSVSPRSALALTVALPLCVVFWDLPRPVALIGAGALVVGCAWSVQRNRKRFDRLTRTLRVEHDPVVRGAARS